MRRPDASYSLELSISCVLTILALLPRFGKPDHDEFRLLARNLAVYAFRRGPRTRVAGWPIQPSAALVGAAKIRFCRTHRARRQCWARTAGRRGESA